MRWNKSNFVNCKKIAAHLLVCVLLLLPTTTVFAWNSIGHRLVAQIAYDELTPQAKAKIDALTSVYFHSRYPEARFLRASTWPDTIRKQAPSYTPWHYIDMPFVQDNVKPPLQNSENVVWAIAHVEGVISDAHATQAERATNLSFLIHFLGDSHQPLHCVSLYNKQFPDGDRGGNAYPIESTVSDNLHGYWDAGLGLFYRAPRTPYLFRHEEIEAMAKQWMADYPRSFFGARLNEKSPNAWVKEGYALSTTFVYATPQNAVPNERYVQKGQAIVREQIVLAGYRLADVLNHLFA